MKRQLFHEGDLSDVPGEIGRPNPAAFDGIALITVGFRTAIIKKFPGNLIAAHAGVIPIVGSPVCSPGIAHQKMAGIAELLLTDDQRLVVFAVFPDDVPLAQHVHRDAIELRMLPDVRAVSDRNR
jgi:hypothetical protein